MIFDILDTQRQEILPFFRGNFSDFYLAGGTALALYLGHRKSIDFDFFTEKTFDTFQLFQKCKKIFQNQEVKLTQNEKNTLSILVNNSVKISFFTFPYPLLHPLKKTDFFSIASINDIAAMKCLALVQRATQKDYVDIFFLLQKYSIEEILVFAKQKFPSLSSEIIVKSIIYFDDIEYENIEYIEKKYDWNDIKKGLEKNISNLI